MLLDLGILASCIICTCVCFTDLSKPRWIGHVPLCDISHALLLCCFDATNSASLTVLPNGRCGGGAGIACQLLVPCIRTAVWTAVLFNYWTVSLHFLYCFVNFSGNQKNGTAESSERKCKSYHLIELKQKRKSLGTPKATLPGLQSEAFALPCRLCFYTWKKRTGLESA